MTNEQPTLRITPLVTAGDGNTASARALVGIGFYEETGHNTFRLTEEGYRWIVLWLPHVIPELITRSQTPERGLSLMLERQNLDLRVQVEELKRGIVSPHRPPWAGNEEA